ncbi:MAG: lipoprotein, partial [Chloroflexota bacterium]
MKRQFLSFLVLALIVVLAACGQRPQAPTPQPTEESSAPEVDSGDSGEQSDDSAEPEPTTAPTTDDSGADGNFWERAQTGEFSGSTVTIFGKWTEAEEENFVNALAPFEEATGIDVQYEG